MLLCVTCQMASLAMATQRWRRDILANRWLARSISRSMNSLTVMAVSVFVVMLLLFNDNVAPFVLDRERSLPVVGHLDQGHAIFRGVDEHRPLIVLPLDQHVARGVLEVLAEMHADRRVGKLNLHLHERMPILLQALLVVVLD